MPSMGGLCLSWGALQSGSRIRNQKMSVKRSGMERWYHGVVLMLVLVVSLGSGVGVEGEGGFGARPWNSRVGKSRFLGNEVP